MSTIEVDNDSIFDKLLTFGSSPSPKNEYYHCIRKNPKSKYECRLVLGDHRIIPIYPDVPKTMHLQVLEGTLGAPAEIK